MFFAYKKQIEVYIACYILTSHHIDVSEEEIEEVAEFVKTNMSKDIKEALNGLKKAIMLDLYTANAGRISSL